MLAFALVASLAPAAQAATSPTMTTVLVAGAPATHKLAVPYLTLGLTVQPASHRLLGAAHLRVNPAPGAQAVDFRLHAGLKVTRVTLNGRAVPFHREGDRLEVPLPRFARAGAKWVLGIDYAGRPLEATGGTTRQDVGPDGVLLHPDGNWYPAPQNAGPLVAAVSVRLPAGWRATGPAGRQTMEASKHLFHLGFTTGSRLAIAAAPYKIYSANGITCYMASEPGAGGTLAQGAALVQFYRGHGVPAVGPRTLVELPASFAPVSAAGWLATPKPPGALGSWLASLTWLPREGAAGPGRLWLTDSLVAYTADLMVARDKGEEAYLGVLRGRLAAYERFMRETPAADVPLVGAIAPSSPAWDPVVLDKGALVWSLVHDELGDKAFWELLASHHAALAKGDATLAAFLDVAGRRLAFVQSWLEQPGLPRYRFAETKVEGQPGAYQVTGVLSQTGPVFDTPLELALVGEDGVDRLAFQSFDARVPFHFTTPTRPLRLVLDPAEKLPLARLKRLWIGECVARPDLTIVYGTQGTPAEAEAGKNAATMIATQLKPRFGEIVVVADKAVTPERRRGPLVLVGRPSVNALLAEWEDQLPVRFMEEGKALWWQGRTFQGGHQGVVEAIPNPEAPDQPVVVLAALDPAALVDGLHFLDRPQTYCVYDGSSVLEEGEALRAYPDLEAVLY